MGNRALGNTVARLTHVGVWSVELPVFRLTASDEALAIHGIRPGGVLTVEEAIERYAPEWREAITQAFRACMQDGTPFDLEAELTKVAGRRVWVRLMGEAVRDALGVIQRIDGAVQDISESKQKAVEIRELAARMTTTLESITDAFFTLDRAWRFTFLNGAAERLLQRTRAELIGEDWRTEFSAAVDSTFGKEYRRAITENHSVAFEEFYLPLKTWFSVRAYPSGEGLAVYFLDITERKHLEEANARALQRLTEAQRIGLIGDWEYDLATGITWSAQVFKIFGRDPSLGAPRSLGDAGRMYDSASSALMAEKVAEAIKSGEPQQYELLAQRPDGTKVYLQAISSPSMDGSGRVVSLHGTVQDISERKRGEQALKDRARQQELIAALGHSALADTHLDHLFIEAGLAVAQGLSVEFSEVMQLGTDNQSFIVKGGEGWDPSWVGRRISPADGGIRLAAVLAGKPSIIDDYRTEQPISTSANLRAYAILSGVNVAIVCSDGPWGVLGGCSRDVGKFRAEHLDFLKSIANILATGIDRRRREDQLVRLAQYDPLTNLPNKLLSNDRLAAAIVQAKRSGTRTAVLYLDLDRFKNVNDAFGQAQGDLLLQEVARRLAASTHLSSTLSRQGGDEFLVLVPLVETGEELERVAEHMIRSIGPPVNIGFDEVVLVTCSIGIACFPDNGKDAETLLRNAASAMCAAKEAGRNCYRFYADEMNARTHERLLLEADLHQAIARGQLFLEFQPQVAMSSGVITGVEALVRWRHPILGLVPPGRFIPVAEESGLVVSIGSWVLEAACRQQAQWVREGIAHGRMAVNVSAMQFRRPAFLGAVSQALEQAGLEPRYLEVELTESVISRGIDGVYEKMTALNKSGVRFAIDDFGTGQSNLGYLRQFPIHHLKIDQSFVKGIPGDKKNGAITQAIISMGHSLGLTVVAEGVETREQAEYLQSMWCDEAQGFYYSRPLSPADCVEFLRRETQRLNLPAPEGT